MEFFIANYAAFMFAGLICFLLLGFPVAFSLAGTALIFAFIGDAFGVFDMRLMGGLASRFFGVMVNEVLVAVPLARYPPGRSGIGTPLLGKSTA